MVILTDTTLPPGFPVTPRLERVLRKAAYVADAEGSQSVGTDHLAQALLEEQEGPHVEVLEAACRRGRLRQHKAIRKALF